MALGESFKFEIGADIRQAQERLDALKTRLTALKGDVDQVDGSEIDVQVDDAELDGARDAVGDLRQTADRGIDIDVDADTNTAQRRLDAVQSDVRDLDGATPEIRPEVDSSELDSFIDKLDEVAGGKLGGLRSAGAAGIAAAVATGWVAAGDAAADAAIEIDNVAKLTGESVEFASALAGVMGRAGVETTDLQDILLQMGGVLQDDVELAERLGINLNDGSTLGQRFIEVVDALGDTFTNTSDRSLVAARLFGEEGVRQVNAVTAAYGDLGEAVDEYNGKIFTAQDAEQAREYKLVLAEVRSEFELIAAEVGAEAVPVLADFLQGLQEIDDWVSDRSSGRGLFAQIGDALTNPFNPASGLIRELQAAGDAGEREARRTSEAFRELFPVFDDLSGAARDAGDDVADAGTRSASAAQLIQSEIDLAASNMRRFGADGVEQMGKVEEATGRVVEGLGFVEELYGRITGRFSEESQLIGIVEQFNQVLESAGKVADAQADHSKDAEAAALDHRKELIRLAEQVVRYARDVEDIPASKVTELVTAIDQNNLVDVQRLLAELTSDRDIRIRLSVDDPGPVKFLIDPSGGAPVVVSGAARPTVTSTPFSTQPDPALVQQLIEGLASFGGPSTRQVTNVYQLGPDPVPSIREYEFAGGRAG